MTKSAVWREAQRRRRRFRTEDAVALLGTGATVAEAARRLGVTDEAIRKRLHSEGILVPDRSMRARVDDALFERLWRCTGIRTEEIARFCGVTRQSVSWRAGRMGLPSRKAGLPRRIDEARLRELWAAGIVTREIAGCLGVHESSVRRMARLLGLPRRGLSTDGAGDRGDRERTVSLDAWREVRLAEAMRADAEAMALRHGWRRRAG